MSIDADYTGNSGFDTVDDFKINKTPTGISNTFYDIFKTIKDKNIKPEIISMSLSPQYLPKKDHEFVNNLFKEIIQISTMYDEYGKGSTEGTYRASTMTESLLNLLGYTKNSIKK